MSHASIIGMPSLPTSITRALCHWPYGMSFTLYSVSLLEEHHHMGNKCYTVCSLLNLWSRGQLPQVQFKEAELGKLQLHSATLNASLHFPSIFSSSDIIGYLEEKDRAIYFKWCPYFLPFLYTQHSCLMTVNCRVWDIRKQYLLKSPLSLTQLLGKNFHESVPKISP